MSRKPTVLITGCSDGGIGQTLAEEYLRRGCFVVATSRNPKSMGALSALGSPDCRLVSLDVTSDESVDRAAAEVRELVGGKLDVLYNNAGISYTSAALDMDVELCKDVFEANVFGVMRVTKAFGEMVVAAKGCVVATGSVAGTFPNPFGGIYHTSKHALHAYMDCLRLELEPFDCRVITVVTGAVQSNIAATAEKLFTLKEGSLYTPVHEEMQKRLTQSQAAGRTSRDEYCREVVGKTLKKSCPPRIYKGRFAGLAWFLQAFSPFWLTAWIMARRFGMHKLYQILHANR
ncbi:NADPH-dependent 1-acyl dihydroxyacetone phosphate reductase [Savitreella phatthalungensis]